MLIHKVRTMKNPAKKFSADNKGIAAVEMAIIMPFLLFLYFGLFDITSFITVSRKVTSSASIVADLVTQNANYVLGTQVTDYYNAPDIVMAPISSTDVRVELFGFRKTGSTIAQFWQKNNGRGSSCGTAPAASTLTNLMTAGNDLVVARVCTPFVPHFASFMGQYIFGKTSYMMVETITQRPRASLQLTCYQAAVNGALCS